MRSDLRGREPRFSLPIRASLLDDCSDQPRKDKLGSEAAAGRIATAGPLMSADDYLARWLVPTSLAAAFKLTVSLPANPP